MNRFLLCLIYSNNFNNNKLNNPNYVIAKYRFRLKKIKYNICLFYPIYDYIPLRVILNQTIVLFLIYIIIITKGILKK